MENRFNLIDEPWIPIADVGRVSLKDVFSHSEYAGLGGNPIQKIAMMKLLLSIAQAACTPEDEEAWRALGWRGMTEQCLDYLNHWHDRFFLYGERPFLQMPAIAKAAAQSCGAVLPQIATGNTTLLIQSQIDRSLEDADRALLLVSLMGFALGGKKTDNSVVLTPGYAGKKNDKGKPSSGKPGPSVAHMGLLHSYFLGESLIQTLWLNLLTREDVRNSRLFPDGVGVAPWEQMPEGEDCTVAKALRDSLQGRLIALCRFCLFDESGLHYSEGVHHDGYKEGRVDPTVAVNSSGKTPKALWVDPGKRPWRELTSLLSFMSQSRTSGFDCLQLRAGLRRIRKEIERFAIWSGGLRISSNAGEQYVSGSDDFVESKVRLESGMLGEFWFSLLEAEMAGLDGLSKGLYGCVSGYFKEQTAEGEKLAGQASHLFWQHCERDSQSLFKACWDDQNEHGREHRQALRRRFVWYVQQVYDQFCPQETARQLDAWAKYRPNTAKYLQQEI
ncbi:type I-E CRISPR-associated protein Cse1/CasA [Alphaproteobacteria bacterium]|nr:type I-E CRISPR-associated protein Cse1/CasA [Alphaproteobacteria bacterium]